MKTRKKLFFFLLPLALLFAGCEKPPAAGLPSQEEVGELETLYGKAWEEVFPFYGVSGEAREEELAAGIPVPQTREIEERSFSPVLLFDVTQNPGAFYGIRYTAVLQDGEDPTVLGRELYAQLEDACGQPDTYPLLVNRISDSWREIEKCQGSQYQEEWLTDNGKTRILLQIGFPDGEASTVTVTYRQEQPPASGLLSEEEIAAVEELYLQPEEAAFARYGIFPGEVSEEQINRGVPAPQLREVGGGSFTPILLLDMSQKPYRFFGVRYTAVLQDGEDPTALGRELYGQLEDACGEPDTYPLLENRLTGCWEEVEARREDSYREEWITENEKTQIILQVNVLSGQISTVEITYRLYVPLN